MTSISLYIISFLIIHSMIFGYVLYYFVDKVNKYEKKFQKLACCFIQHSKSMESVYDYQYKKLSSLALQIVALMNRLKSMDLSNYVTENNNFLNESELEDNIDDIMSVYEISREESRLADLINKK